MKYTGTISITDEDGNIVYDQELSADEIIEMLVKNRSAAPRFEDVRVATAKVEKVSKKVGKSGRKITTCSNCGVEGHKKTTCSRGAKASKKDGPAFDPGALTEKEFVQVKESQKHGMSSKDVAENLMADLAEVNAAFSHARFDKYLASRTQE